MMRVWNRAAVGLQVALVVLCVYLGSVWPGGAWGMALGLLVSPLAILAVALTVAHVWDEATGENERHASELARREAAFVDEVEHDA